MRIARKFYIGAASLVVAAGAFVTFLNANGSAVTMGDRRDCGYTDVIINCGATSQAELLQKYDSNDDGRGNRDIQAIFNHYGIQRSDIAGTTSEVKRGWMNTNGVISVDGKTVATNAKSLYRVWVDHDVSPVSIGGKTYYIGPVANNYRLGADVFVFFKNGVFHAAIQSSCGNPIVATPEKPEPKPEYACNSLSASKLDRTRFRFTSSATAKNGAEIVDYNYDFGDGNKTTGGATVEHTYAQPGNYTITMTVNVRVNGQIKVVPGANCKTTIKVEEEPKQPVYKCESLKATKINRTTYQFTAAATASNGAEIVNYTYNFGDGKSTTSSSTQVNHTYAQPGNYTATLTVNFKVNGKNETATGANCKVTIKIEEEPKQPVYKCESLKATKINRTTYRFNASATAQNGATIESYTYNFGDGKSTTSANAQVEHTYAAAGTYTATLTVNFKVNGKNETATGANCKVTIKVEEEPKQPEYKCESLKATKINRTTYRFTTSASAANGAEIVNYTYDFGDGSRSTTDQSVVTHEYDDAGNYTAKVTVNVRVNGQVIAVNDGKCKVKIEVEEEPVKPTYKCESLTARLIETKDRTYAYTLTYAADGGAELDRVVYDFGDGTSETFTPANATSVEHTFAQPGNYTTKTTLYFNVPNGEQTVEKSDTCEVKIKIEKPENCPLPGKEHLPKDSPECKEDEEYCPVPGKEHLPKDSEECYEPCPYDENLPKDSTECVETPPELPKTGLDLMIGGGLGLGSLTAAGYYYATSRRNLLNALHNK